MAKAKRGRRGKQVDSTFHVAFWTKTHVTVLLSVIKDGDKASVNETFIELTVNEAVRVQRTLQAFLDARSETA